MNKGSDYYITQYIKWKTKYLNLVGGKKKKKTKKKIARSKEISKNKILGCFYGLCIGDAIGTRYEFTNKNEAITMIKNDMENNKLPLLGGGPFKTLPGQISDDSEMMLCLLRSLAEKGK